MCFHRKRTFTSVLRNNSHLRAGCAGHWGIHTLQGEDAGPFFGLVVIIGLALLSTIRALGLAHSSVHLLGLAHSLALSSVRTLGPIFPGPLLAWVPSCLTTCPRSWSHSWPLSLLCSPLLHSSSSGGLPYYELSLTPLARKLFYYCIHPNPFTLLMHIATIPPISHF